MKDICECESKSPSEICRQSRGISLHFAHTVYTPLLYPLTYAVLWTRLNSHLHLSYFSTWLSLSSTAFSSLFPANVWKEQIDWLKLSYFLNSPHSLIHNFFLQRWSNQWLKPCCEYYFNKNVHTCTFVCLPYIITNPHKTVSLWDNAWGAFTRPHIRLLYIHVHSFMKTLATYVTPRFSSLASR